MEGTGGGLRFREGGGFRRESALRAQGYAGMDLGTYFMQALHWCIEREDNESRITSRFV